ncbi:FAD/NAD(P)-binding protein [Achromobacter aloeverae]|nr:FAD/NAD(P)-binding protein [Achromobacter aloeverae]
MTESLKLAIVGGGSVAVSFLAQFLRAWPGPVAGLDAGRRLEVVLFEPRAEVGPGTAYQDDSASNLLNIPVGRMSALARVPGDFLDWLRARDPAWLREQGVDEATPSSFLPRPVFGHYLRDLHRDCLALAARKGVRVERVAAAVVGVWPARIEGEGGGDGLGAIVLAADGTRIDAHRVVLCNGNLPSTAFEALGALPGYFNSPYPVADLTARIGADDAVAIVGTSLSAIDAIAALAARGHRGPVFSVSRNGRLPSVRSPHNRTVKLPDLPLPEPDGRVTLDGVLDSLRRALREEGGIEEPDDILGLPGPARTALDAEIARSQAGPRPWQAVAAATNDRIEHIWHALDDSERRRFHRDWRTLWMARRATFPMRNALTVQGLLKRGQLRVEAGFRDVRYDAARGLFEIACGTAEGGGTLGAPWLVNATSFSMDVEGTSDPLVKRLLADGHARAHPLGGFDQDFETGCLRDADGRIVSQVSVLGSLAAGTYFWTTSMEVNARLALGQAERLAREMRVAMERPMTRTA